MADLHPHPLRAARRFERFTLRQLGAVTGLNFRRINAIENGARPSQIEARLLAAALRISVRRLLDAATVQQR
jgi:transcriptional regulator with XRE-family HTH domain